MIIILLLINTYIQDFHKNAEESKSKNQTRH